MSQLIQPRTLKGFRDFLPEAMIPRERLMETVRQVYRSYGFVPIETPVLEYAEVLCGKGSDETDKQMYRFLHGKRDVAMRFDLTVPLARFAAEHYNDLGLPFKRYHIGMVWRGEKPQVGRYREFAQCDFDTIGTRSIASDIETGLVIFDLLKALGFERFQIRVNNRKVLNGLLEKFELSTYSVQVLRALDKLEKIGREKVKLEMLEIEGATESQVDQILKISDVEGTTDKVLSQIEPLVAGNELGLAGVEELRQLTTAASAVGISSEHLKLDISIARGLDYYTGTIFETVLGDLPNIGSVCSGGRYDNLAGMFTKQELPGIGASLGLDRLLAAMETLKMIPPTRTTADVLIVQFDKDSLPEYLKIAKQLRSSGFGVEVFPDTKKLAQQFKYADRRGFPAVLIAGSNELEAGKVTIKWLADGSQRDLSLANQGQEITEFLEQKLRTNN